MGNEIGTVTITSEIIGVRDDKETVFESEIYITIAGDSLLHTISFLK
jgi:hypothetical protein